jgi:carbamoyl-phosphate synthase large subunit
MEHIEQAGVHSGDSACSMPPFSLSVDIQDEIRRQTIAMAKALRVVGLMNVQFAIQNGDIYVLEVNPRASRTVPYVSKSIGIPLAKIAARCMAGISLSEQLAHYAERLNAPQSFYTVKEAVFPFIKFPGVDTILGPEMKSTGEVMGIGRTFAEAFYKAQLAAGVHLPASGTAFLSVRDADKPGIVDVARTLHKLGFNIVATRGTAKEIEKVGIPVTLVNKVHEGRPNVVDHIKNQDVQLVINTVDERRSAIKDSFSIRRAALQARLPYFTTLAGARAAALGIEESGNGGGTPYALHDVHPTAL